MSTWRELIAADHPDAVVTDVAPDESVLDVEFDSGYGTAEGPHFLAWSTTHVFFPVDYDGAESVGSAPRNPTTEGQAHV